MYIENNLALHRERFRRAVDRQKDRLEGQGFDRVGVIFVSEPTRASPAFDRAYLATLVAWEDGKIQMRYSVSLTSPKQDEPQVLREMR